MSIPSAPSDYENPNQNDEGIQRECIILKKTNIHVVEGNIVTQKVDVILNSTHKNLDLSLGTCSSALRYAAGPEIQRECDQKYPNGIEAGELATTSGGRLNCNAIFHTALLKWPSRSSKKVHQEFIEKSLKEAQSRGYSSMAIPGLCTGYLQCPHKEAAERQCLYIKEFIEKHPSTTLKDIKLVASSNDKDMLKHLITAVKKIDRLSRNLYDEQSIIMNMEIKNTKLVVVKGRIEKSHVDVVVNIVNSRLQLNLGKVSRTLLKVGGDIIETECRRSSPHGIKLGEIVSTSGGNLPCKKVFHACMWDFNYKDSKTSKQIVSDLVENCLMMSHRANMMSIAFPFMRFWNIPPNHFAKAMYDGIQRFLSSLDASTIQNITIALSAPKFPLARTIRAFRDEFGVDNLTTEIPKDVVGFCYEMYKTEVTCPDYWDAFKEGMPLKQLALGRTQVYNLINIPVNDNMYEAIERLTKNTWDPSKIGFGRDAAGLTGYQDIQIIKIERIENINLWMRYGNERTYCFKKVVDQKCKFRNLTQLPGSRGVLLTTQHLPSVLQPRLYSEINEVYLFHGTKEENIYSILTDGLDKRLSSNAMFGSGIYFAESSTKADQYTDCKTDRSMDQKRFFLSRVCLGNTYIIEEPRSLRKPPCTICKEEVCRVHDRINFADSVVADGKCLFREFIVFNNNQCYPEYLITYARK
ncbi:protein mono-ADP-ribosyltransferase PARP14-like [Mytilus trossulus]|uniref:protein mono-ADP-ribosyltransferase PARP14-like n=1 Tax=Mytilus trossulus TaxID=6551 RepID=UPI003004EBCA